MICPDCSGFGDEFEGTTCPRCNGWGHIGDDGRPKRPCPICFRFGCRHRPHQNTVLPPPRKHIGYVIQQFPSGISIESSVHEGDVIPTGTDIRFNPLT